MDRLNAREKWAQFIAYCRLELLADPSIKGRVEGESVSYVLWFKMISIDNSFTLSSQGDEVIEHRCQFGMNGEVIYRSADCPWPIDKGIKRARAAFHGRPYP